VLAFRDLDRLAARARRIVDANSRLVDAFFARRPELECVSPAATIAFPRFVDGRDSAPFAERLLRYHGVAVVRGAFFDLPAHFRIAFGGATDAVEEGLRAIEETLRAEA
jgi:aspartate/methionine/tyrosine aminotransferase